MAEPTASQALDPVDLLRNVLDSGMTGCAYIHDRAGSEFRVYIMGGELLAAHAPRDSQHVVRRLVNNRALIEREGREMIRRLDAGESFEDVVLGRVPDDLVYELLAARFRQNVLSFISGTGDVGFEEMDAVFVENIQVGHDTPRLVNELQAQRQRVQKLKRHLEEITLHPGAAPALDDVEQHLLDVCGESLSLAALVAYSPYEEGETLDVIARMAGRGVLRSEQGHVLSSEKPGQKSPGYAAAAAPSAGGALEELDELGVEEFDTFDGDPLEPILEEVVSDRASGSYGDDIFVDDGPMVDDGPLVEDGPVVVDEPVVASRPPATDLFGDHDHHRGGGKGQFSVDKSLLDRVDLGSGTSAPVRAAPTGGIRLGGQARPEAAPAAAPKKELSLNYDGPKMNVADLKRKIDVCNEVLAEIARAVDRQNGLGTGKAAIQLLLETTRMPFSVLFQGIRIDATGAIPLREVINNLRTRPPAEHRRLVKQGVDDLINRALSTSCDELDEELIDEMFDAIAGYQERMGV